MTESTLRGWPLWQRLVFRFGAVCLPLWMLTFPYHRPYLPDFGKLLFPLTVTAAEWSAVYIWKIPKSYLPEIANDSTLLYVHMANVLIVSLLVSVVWSLMDKKRLAYPQLYYLLRVAIRYFLATVMITYGLVKVFKYQFYLPEPNTLYTPIGEVPRDLLFWSTMGTSRAYSVFSGCLEVLAGGLFFWRRTTLVGALLALGIMANVLAINLSFDISVKVFSMLLCLLSCVLIAPSMRGLLNFLLGKQGVAARLWEPLNWDGWRRPAYLLAKSLLLAWLLLDAMGPYFVTGNFNDDHAPRPALHGAYEVKQLVLNGDTIAPDLRNEMRWRRVFIHRKGFFEIQTMDGRMQDYALEVDTLVQTIKFVDPVKPAFGEFEYHLIADSTMVLAGQMNLDTLAVTLRQLDWRNLPLLKGEFHWTSDEF